MGKDVAFAIEQRIESKKQKKTLRMQIITAVSVLVAFVAIVSGIFAVYSTNKSTQDCLSKSAVATAEQRLKQLLKKLKSFQL